MMNKLLSKFRNAIFALKCFFQGVSKRSVYFALYRLTNPANFEPFEFNDVQFFPSPTRLIVVESNGFVLVLRYSENGVVAEFSTDTGNTFDTVFNESTSAVKSGHWQHLLNAALLVEPPQAKPISNEVSH